MNRTRTLILGLLLVGGLPAQQPSQRAPYVGPDAEMALAGSVTARRLVQGVRALSDREGPAAWRWIEERAEELGLPLSRMPAQARRIARARGAGCGIVVEGARHELQSAWPLFGATPAEGEEGPLRPGRASDLRGAWVWVPMEVPGPSLGGELLRDLADRGASGALVGFVEDDPEVFAGAPLWPMTGDGGPAAFPVVSLGPGDTRVVAQALASGKTVRASVKSSISRSEAPARSLLIERRGEREAPLVLVTACWTRDRGGPAATGRASGVVALLEIARILQVSIRAGEIRPLPFELLFAVWSHEEGMAEWTAAHPEKAKRLALCIHLERLGPGRPEGTLFLDTFGSAPDDPLVSRTRALLEGYAGRRGFWPGLVTLAAETPRDAIPWRLRPLPPAPCLTLSTAPADPLWARSPEGAKDGGAVVGFGPQLLTGWDHPDHLDAGELAFGLVAGTRAALVLILRLAEEGLE